MPLNIPAGYAQVSFGGLVDGDLEEMVITIGIDLDGALTPGIALALFNHWSDSFFAVSSTEWTFKSCRVKAGPNETGPVDEYTDAGVSGTKANALLPPNVACLVQKRTGVGGRQNRGRCYQAGVAVQGEANSAGLLDTDWLSAIDAAWFTFNADLGDVPGVVGPVLFHNNVSDPTPITSFQPQQLLATQRRRLRP